MSRTKILALSASRRLRLAVMTFLVLFAVKVAAAVVAPERPGGDGSTAVIRSVASPETLERME